jgi:ribonucleoside-diphosphate reductase alpha chain
MEGKTYRMKTGYGNLYITVNNDESGSPFEVFASIGKTGGVMQEQSEGLCRMISIALRAGVSISEVIDQLKGIRGPMPAFTEHGTIYSLPDAIGRVLEMHLEMKIAADAESLPAPQATVATTETKKEEEPVLVSTQPTLVPSGKSIADMGYAPECPECGDLVQMAEGCISCRACGFSRCG